MNGSILALFAYLYTSEQGLINWLIATDFIIVVFLYHRLISTTEEFQAKYPGLYQNLDRNKYYTSMAAFIAVPYGVLLLITLLIINRYDTRSFLKMFATKRRPNRRV